MAEYIEREALLKAMSYHNYYPKGKHFLKGIETAEEIIEHFPAADVQPVVRCKDCKHFHLDYFGEVNGVNIIVAHEICDLWAEGCRTTQDTFCSNGVRKDGKT